MARGSQARLDRVSIRGAKEKEAILISWKRLSTCNILRQTQKLYFCRKQLHRAETCQNAASGFLTSRFYRLSFQGRYRPNDKYSRRITVSRYILLIETGYMTCTRANVPFAFCNLQVGHPRRSHFLTSRRARPLLSFNNSRLQLVLIIRSPATKCLFS